MIIGEASGVLFTMSSVRSLVVFYLQYIAMQDERTIGCMVVLASSSGFGLFLVLPLVPLGLR